jgi:hypothetical protein
LCRLQFSRGGNGVEKRTFYLNDKKSIEYC